MCGIVGYVGFREAQPVLLTGLEHLEYRGYDSAGIAVANGGKIGILKCVGRVARLEEQAKTSPLTGKCGIGHTRWATHGAPEYVNAHPQTDQQGGIAVVHNGMIENHECLRAQLTGRGYAFRSETDTEIIAHLIHDFYRGDMLFALRRAMDLLEGSYALAVLCEGEENCVYCARQGSSLVIGTGEKEMFLSSDIPGLLPYTREVICLEDQEIAVLRPGGVQIYDGLLRPRTAAPEHISWDLSAAEKGGYAHFMLKETMEQPRAIKQTLSAYQGQHLLDALPPVLPRRVDLIACGTAYHACCLGAHYLRSLAGVDSESHIASEYRYRPVLKEADEWALAVSQSGETADTLAAAQHARRQGKRLIALSNTLGSSLLRCADDGFLTYAGPEIAVASTKAFTAQTAALLLFAVKMGEMSGRLDPENRERILHGLAGIPEKMEAILRESQGIRAFCERHASAGTFFFLGRGADVFTAMEGALKLREVAYLPCEAYPAGEMKHGPIALIEKGTPVIAICTQAVLLEKTLSNLTETKARGAETVCICPEKWKGRALGAADQVWLLPDAEEETLPLLSVLPLQLLAYYMALTLGRPVDQPRNLAKSVTVE